MRKILLTSLILFTVFITGCSNPEEAANELFVNKAIKLIKQAEQSQSTNLEESLSYYKKAILMMDKIIKKYPASSIAVKLASGDEVINNKTLNDYRQIIVPEIEKRIKIKNNPLSLALDLAQSTNIEPERRDYFLKYIAYHYAKLNKFSEAFTTIEKIDDIELKIQAMVSCSLWLNKLSSSNAAIDLLNEATLLLPHLKNKDSFSKNKIRIAKKLYIFGDRVKAIEFVDNVSKDLKQANVKEQLELIKETVSSYVLFGETSKAQEIAELFITKNDSVSSLSESNEQENLAEIYALIGDIEKVITILNQATSSFLKYLNYRSVSFELAKAKQYDSAIKLVKMTGDNGYISDTYLFIARHNERNGNKEDAIDALKKMGPVILSLDSREDKARVNADISILYTELKEPELGIKYAQAAYESFNSYTEPDLSDIATIAIALLKAGKNNKANEIIGHGEKVYIEEINSSYVSLRGVFDYLQALEVAGRFTDAISNFEQIPDGELNNNIKDSFFVITLYGIAEQGTNVTKDNLDSLLLFISINYGQN
ncbi:tetratricopeptide repeat protein [Thermodesulfobacteriota bacterium]